MRPRAARLTSAVLASLALLTYGARVALAHAGEPVAPHDLTGAWTRDPFILSALALVAWLYGRGLGRLWRAAERGRGIRRWEAWCFVAGWVMLAIALASPLHALGESLFSAHMAQHELLMAVAAPLLVLGRPLVPFVWALPLPWRQRSGAVSRMSAVRRVWGSLTTPLAAWSIHAAALWIWHLPGPYQSTLTSGTMHFLQHASFLGSALLFWWALLHGREGVMGYGTAVLYVFTTMLHTGLLGALLTFSPTVWYPAYYATTAPWGLTALEDQQLGGLIMWIPAGLIYIVAALALMARLLRHSELQMRRGARAAGVALLIAGSSVLLAGCQPEPADAGDAAIALTGGDPERGKAEIRRFGCGSCHVIPGVRGAEGMVGPPLAGIANRMYLGGVLTNTPEHMMRWIMTPKEVDSLTVMPNLGVDAVQARHIAAYLYTLR